MVEMKESFQTQDKNIAKEASGKNVFGNTQSATRMTLFAISIIYIIILSNTALSIVHINGHIQVSTSGRKKVIILRIGFVSAAL